MDIRETALAALPALMIACNSVDDAAERGAEELAAYAAGLGCEVVEGPVESVLSEKERQYDLFLDEAEYDVRVDCGDLDVPTMGDFDSAGTVFYNNLASDIKCGPRHSFEVDGTETLTSRCWESVSRGF